MKRLRVFIVLSTVAACAAAGAGSGTEEPVQVQLEPLASASAASDGEVREEPVPPKPIAEQRGNAQVLFEQGRELMQAGQYDEACDKFAQSLAAESSLGGLLNLAKCEELAGRVDQACRHYSAVAEQGAREGQKQREAVARQLMKKLNCP